MILSLVDYGPDLVDSSKPLSEGPSPFFAA